MEDRNLEDPKSDNINEQSSQLSATGSVTGPTNGSDTPQILPNTPQKKSKKPLRLLLAGVLLLAVGSAGYWLYLDNKSTTPSTTVIDKKDIPVLSIAFLEEDLSVTFPDDESFNFDINTQAFETLVGYEDNKIVPILAESWANPNDTTWDFTLKQGVKFHTGKTFTASDVKASIEVCKKSVYYDNIVSTIADVQVLNDNKVRITTTKPDALLLNRLIYAFILDTTSNAEYSIQKGSGPYTLKSGTKPASEELYLTAFNNYHGSRPLARELHMKFYEGGHDDALAAARKGEVDILYNRLNHQFVEDFEKIGFKHVDNTNISGAYGIHLNTLRQGAPFQNKDLRKAASLALDRQKVIDAVGLDLLPLSQSIPKNTTGHLSSISEEKQNVSKAKDLMKKAGYTNQPIKFLYMSTLQPEAIEAMNQLEAAGFTIEKTDIDAQKIISEWSTGKYDLLSLSYYSDFNDGSDILRSVIDKDLTPTATYSAPDLLDTLVDADSELNDDQRLQSLQSVNQKLFDDTAWIPLRTLGVAVFHKPGIVINPFRNSGGFNIYFKDVYAL